jgi:hypothetical protein
MSVLTYRAETWTQMKTDISTLTAAEVKFLTNIEGKPKLGKRRERE